MHPRTTAVALLIVLSGCPKAVPPPGPAVPPPLTAEQQLAKEVDALGSEALALVKEEDELLWAHWTQGVPLELEKPALRHSVLFEEATLAKVRAARARGVGHPVGVQRLERWLVGERLARATAEANATLSGQEAAATFDFDGKPLAWRDLSRLLANEKSAVKRRALWAASREAIPALAEAYRKRDQAVAEALAALGTTAAEYAGVSSEQSAAIGKQLLDDTEAEWKQVLERLSKAELGLPSDKLSRAGLPRLLRPSTAADATFPRADQATRATALLGALGLYGRPGLTLELAESAKKNPLPLTVAPGGPADVRVSFRPAGGARDVSALLGELGRALALHGSGEPAEALPRLAGPLTGDVSFRLFADLAASPEWLEAQGVSDAAAASTLTSARALRLFTWRRAAANLIAQHEARGQSDEAAAQSWRTWAARALAVQIAPEDGPRWALERDPLFRGVELLEAPRRAELLRQKLGPAWWADPASTEILRAAWSGGALPASSTVVRGAGGAAGPGIAPRDAGAAASGQSSAPRDAGAAPGQSSALHDSSAAPIQSSASRDAGAAPVQSSAPRDAGAAAAQTRAPRDASALPAQSSAPRDAGAAPMQTRAPRDAGAAPRPGNGPS